MWRLRQQIQEIRLQRGAFENVIWMPKVKPYKPSRIFLETLEGYIEASRVKLLTEFVAERKKTRKVRLEGAKEKEGKILASC